MIKFELRCPQDHRFEGWFQSGDAYDAQAAAGEIACPVCGDAKISKALMAPSIVRGGKREADDKRKTVMAAAMKQLAELRRQVEENCDYVGDRFAEEARRIHYGETERRDIYGETTEDEARELAEEGVEFARVPWVSRADN